MSYLKEKKASEWILEICDYFCSSASIKQMIDNTILNNISFAISQYAIEEIEEVDKSSEFAEESINLILVDDITHQLGENKALLSDKNVYDIYCYISNGVANYVFYGYDIRKHNIPAGTTYI